MSDNMLRFGFEDGPTVAAEDPDGMLMGATCVGWLMAKIEPEAFADITAITICPCCETVILDIKARPHFDTIEVAMLAFQGLMHCDFQIDAPLVQ